MLSNRRTVRIEWGDCDPVGIVFYPRYFAMFNHSTELAVEAALGCKKPALFRDYEFDGYPVIETRARFLIPTRHGDDVVIETSITEVRRSSFHLQHRLLKNGSLTHEERAVMETHVLIGYSMLEPLPYIRASLPAIRGHHERWDGRGYPDRLARKDVHQHARLMAVADAYDAMTSARPYRSALPIKEAVRRLRKDRGKQFDPAAIDLFDAVETEFTAICEHLREMVIVFGGCHGSTAS